jgi:hypothetical protein
MRHQHGRARRVVRHLLGDRAEHDGAHGAVAGIADHQDLRVRGRVDQAPSRPDETMAISTVGASPIAAAIIRSVISWAPL